MPPAVRVARAWSVGARYRLLRWALVGLRRISMRYSINFDNAVESSAKDELDLLAARLAAVERTLRHVGARTHEDSGAKLNANGMLTDWLAGHRSEEWNGPEPMQGCDECGGQGSGSSFSGCPSCGRMWPQ